MEQGKPVNPETCELSRKQIAFEMVRAVQGLHSIGIIHGDIKLPSFLVCRDGRVRLCDFGTSEYESDCVSHSEISIPWSRPSLVRNPDRPRVKADDLYSLGLAIWELYTGKVPFVPPASEGWKSLDINEAAEEAILAGEQVDLNDILDPEVRSVAASLVSVEVDN
jgi:serine/threonine protein kinase